MRFNILSVIDILGSYKILEGLSGLTYMNIKPYLRPFANYLSSQTSPYQSLSFFTAKSVDISFSERHHKQQKLEIAYSHKLSFFHLLTTAYFIEHPEHSWKDWQATGLVHKIKPRDHFHLHAIFQAIQERNPSQAILPNLVEFIEAALELKQDSLRLGKTLKL
jgi:hypothetical protein